MALPLPQGKQFMITYRNLPGDFEMPSMEVASDHYSLGFIICGDRKVITPTMTYYLHPGYINALAPFVYHRTVPASREHYENYLIKFSPEYAQDFISTLGPQVMDNIFNEPPKKFSAADEKELFDLAGMLLRTYESSEDEGSDGHSSTASFRCRHLLYSMLSLINDRGISALDSAARHSLSLSEPILEAVYYIEKNYSRPVKIEDVAAICGYSVSYFSKLFSAQLGRPFSEYLCLTRLKHVQNLLLSTDMSVMDISLECGFSYPGNMTASFKKEFNMTPLQFRKKKST